MRHLHLLQNMIVSHDATFLFPKYLKRFVVRRERICMNLIFKCHPIVEAPREVGTGMKCCL